MHHRNPAMRAVSAESALRDRQRAGSLGATGRFRGARDGDRRVTDGFVTVLPSAGRLMRSLRDIGYAVPSAIADLVDNSIDANARRIDITLRADGPTSWVRVVDDGLGMSAAALDEAMRYGSTTKYAPRALGHF